MRHNKPPAALWSDCSDKPLTVTLTGQQWHCLLNDVCGVPLSPMGQNQSDDGYNSLVNQLKDQTR